MNSLIILSSCLLVMTAATSFDDCGSTATNVILDFPGCIDPPCIVTRGETYPAKVTFVSTEDSDSVHNSMSANIGGIQTPWPGVDTDGCNNLAAGGTPCPVTDGGAFTWVMDVEILPDYPAITCLATIAFEAESGNTMVCMKIPVTITK